MRQKPENATLIFNELQTQKQTVRKTFPQMRKIKVTKIVPKKSKSVYTRDLRHQLNIGNGYTVYFENAKDCAAYAVELDEFLNLKALELNEIYIDLWSNYRKYCLIYATFFLHDRKIKMHILNLDRDFEKLITRTRGPNGHHFCFNIFNSIIVDLRAFAEYLIDAIKTARLGMLWHLFDIILARLDAYSESLKNYGKAEQVNTPNHPFDFSVINTKKEL